MAEFADVDAFSAVFEDSDTEEEAPRPGAVPATAPGAARVAEEAAAEGGHGGAAGDEGGAVAAEIVEAAEAGEAAGPLDPLASLDLSSLDEHLRVRGFRELLPDMSAAASAAYAAFTSQLRADVEACMAAGSLLPSQNRLATRRHEGRVVDGKVLAKTGVWELDVVLEGRVVRQDVLDRCPAIAAFHESYGESLVARLNDACGSLKLTNVDTIKLQCNEGAGGCFPMHYDTRGSQSRRGLTMLFYLNEAWEPSHGGELRLFPFPFETVDIAPRMGTAALFCATEMLHRVLPARHRRVCLSVWFATASSTDCSFPSDVPEGLDDNMRRTLRFLMQRDNRRLLSKVWHREEYAQSFRDAFASDDAAAQEAVEDALRLDAAQTDRAEALLPAGLKESLREILPIKLPAL